MEFSAKKGALSASQADVLVVGVPSGVKRLSGPLAAADKASGGGVKAALGLGEFEGKPGQALLMPGVKGGPRLAVVGLGPTKEIDVAKVEAAYAAAADLAAKAKLKRAAVALPSGMAAAKAACAIAAGMSLASYDEQLHQTGSRRRGLKPLSRVNVYAADEPLAELRAGLKRGAALAAGTNLARDLVNEPGNVLKPRDMAAAARKLAKEFSTVRCTVWGEKEMAKRGMGGILGVGRGSREESQFIQLEYKPSGSRKLPKIAIVGKGLTFDTGGISLKPPPGMELMKFDMGGAAAVIGAIRILAELDTPVHVLGIVGSAENMPDGAAIKPGDLLTMMNGMTVEVNNTDAEGRLVLADCLYHATRQKPEFIVDAATLTGACMIALGDVACGLMSEDDKLVSLIEDASKALRRARVAPASVREAPSRRWKGHVADLKNTGPREGGALTAAGFLSRLRRGKLVGPTWTSPARCGPKSRRAPFLSRRVQRATARGCSHAIAESGWRTARLSQALVARAPRAGVERVA